MVIFFIKTKKKIEARNLKQVRILIKSKKLDLFLGVFIKIVVSNIFLLISIIALDCMSVSMSVRPSICMPEMHEIIFVTVVDWINSLYLMVWVGVVNVWLCV